MASDIIWRDGFDFLTAAELNSRCSEALGRGGDASADMATSADYSRWPTGRGLRRAAASPSTTVSRCSYVLESPLSQICISGAVYRRVNPASGGVSVFFLAAATGTVAQLKIRIGPGGFLQLTNNAGTVLATTTQALPLNNWIWVSVRIIRHAATGSVRMVLQGLEDITVPNINTDPTTSEYARFGYGNLNTTGETATGTVTDGAYWLDDVHVSTDILTERRVATIYPASDVLAEWTRNAGADNFGRVNQAISDGDTTYVAADDQGTKDIYGFDALPAGVGDIDGVTINIVARKEEAGDTRKLTGLVRISEVDHYFADEHTLLTSYSHFSSVMPDPPSGGWTEAKLEKFGMDLTVGEVV